MEKIDKELLLEDLCARLPYDVVGKCKIDASYDTSFVTIFQTHKFDAVVYGIKKGSLFVIPLIEDKDKQKFVNEKVANGIDILDFTPYLLPMSSMTEEQEKEYNDLNNCELGCFPHTEEALDYLIKNHFDYRGLIEKGLAIDAANLNIY